MLPGGGFNDGGGSALADAAVILLADRDAGCGRDFVLAHPDVYLLALPAASAPDGHISHAQASGLKYSCLFGGADRDLAVQPHTYQHAHAHLDRDDYSPCLADIYIYAQPNTKPDGID